MINIYIYKLWETTGLNNASKIFKNKTYLPIIWLPSFLGASKNASVDFTNINKLRWKIVEEDVFSSQNVTLENNQYICHTLIIDTDTRHTCLCECVTGFNINAGRELDPLITFACMCMCMSLDCECVRENATRLQNIAGYGNISEHWDTSLYVLFL